MIWGVLSFPVSSRYFTGKLGGAVLVAVSEVLFSTRSLVYIFVYSRGQKPFPVKDQMVNILEFVGHMTSVFTK